MNFRKYTILFLALYFAACSEVPENQVQKLARVYVDLEIAREFSVNADSLKIKTGKVFAKYNLTKAEYDSLLKSIPEKSETWNKFFAYAQSYLDSLRLAATKKPAEENTVHKKGL
jgi:hypothetical protein